MKGYHLLMTEHDFSMLVQVADGTIRKYPSFPSEKKMASTRYVEAKQPSLIADALILVTGEIPRKTSFEKEYPRHRVLINGVWQPDPWIWNDRALVIHVKRKGLIIFSGCAHADIVTQYFTPSSLLEWKQFTPF